MCAYLPGFDRAEALLLLANVSVMAVVTVWFGSGAGLGGVELLALH